MAEHRILGLKSDKLLTILPRSPKDTIGRFFLYVYDPKWKNDNRKLPYYDRFPLVLLVGFIGHKYMIGLNFHYLPYRHRLLLLKKLLPLKIGLPVSSKDRNAKGHFVKGNKYRFLSNEEDLQFRLRLSYELLKLYKSRAPEWVPCFKKYIIRRIKSKVLQIPSSQWLYVLSLPLDRFKKRTNRTVWRHSLEAIRKARSVEPDDEE